jgi:DNA-binding FadR family transcriptional regulator
MSRIQASDERVKLRTLPTQVAAILARRIMDGALGDGHAPSELDVTREFGVSRVVAREALKILASLDMVEIAQGRRVVLRPPAEWDYLSPLLIEWLSPEDVDGLLRELHQVRMLLEPELAAGAAAAIDGRALRRIHDELERMRRLEDDPDAYLESDLAFHMEICKAARNRLLDRIMYSSRWLLTASRKITNQRPSALALATGHHRAIYDALAARDPEAARDAMRAHVTANAVAWSGRPPMVSASESREGGR